jgi:8-oxo-dGTP diphosphatase
MTAPRLAVSVAVVKNGQVLVIRRAKAPFIDHYSLPGGHVEVRETLEAAVLRELKEETGLEARIIGPVDVLEIHAPDEPVLNSIVLHVFVAYAVTDHITLNAEASDSLWVTPAQLQNYRVTPHLHDIMRRALDMAESR